MLIRDLMESTLPSHARTLPEDMLKRIAQYIRGDDDERLLMDWRIDNGHGPYEDDKLPSDEEFDAWVYDWVGDKAYECYYQIVHFFRDDNIRGYRMITAPADWKPDQRHPGLYWSWDKRAADAHWGSFKEGHVKWMLEADIPWSAIDWTTTLAQNVGPSSEEEKELRVIDGFPIRLDEFYRVR